MAIVIRMHLMRLPQGWPLKSFCNLSPASGCMTVEPRHVTCAGCLEHLAQLGGASVYRALLAADTDSVADRQAREMD